MSGGVGNGAVGFAGSVTGGEENTAEATGSVVSGGNDKAESNNYGWTGGSYESH